MVRHPQHEWESVCWPLVEAWNNKNNPPLSYRELRGVFDSIKSRQTTKNPHQNISPYTIGTSVTQVGEVTNPLTFKPILLSEISATEDPVEWIWEGYIAKGHQTLLSALWKAGKTTLITYFLKCLQEGKELAGQPTTPCNVLILSEESGTLWARRREESEITTPIWIYPRPIKQKLDYKGWVLLLEGAAQFCEENKIDLFILDTLAGFWSVDNENDAARVSAALLPINNLLDKKIAVLLVHHFRKSGGDEGTAARGSGQLGAAVDIIVELSKLDSTNPNSTQRVLKTYSRFEESPKEVVIDYVDDEYITVGTTTDVRKDEKQTRILHALEDYPEGITITELIEKWNKEEFGKQPAKRTLQTYLPDLVRQGEVEITKTTLVKGGKATVYKLVSVSTDLRQEHTSEDLSENSNSLENLCNASDSENLAQVEIAEDTPLTQEEKALIEKEQKLRNSLSALDKNSSEYAANHHEWLQSR